MTLPFFSFSQVAWQDHSGDIHLPDPYLAKVCKVLLHFPMPPFVLSLKTKSNSFLLATSMLEDYELFDSDMGIQG